jgi:hypothetical protein
MAMRALPSNTPLYHAVSMYGGGLERLGPSLAWKLGLHWVTLAHFANNFTTFPK